MGEEQLAGQQRLVPMLLPNYSTRLPGVPQTSFYALQVAQLTLGSVMAPNPSSVMNRAVLATPQP